MSDAFIDKTDFDIQNYNIEELVNILGLGSEIPLTNEKIVRVVTVFKNKFKNNSKLSEQQREHFTTFFDEIQRKLLENKKNETVKDIFDKGVNSRITMEDYHSKDRTPSVNKMLPNNVISESRIKGLESANPIPFEAFSKDYKNPLLRNTQKQLVTIDSTFRSILSDKSVFCPGDSDLDLNSSTAKKLETSSNFTVNLVPPIKNVMELAFDSAYIPHCWWTYSSDYGTSTFFESEEKDIDGTLDYEFPIQVDITEGNYPSGSRIIQELNEKSQYFKFYYNDIQEKIAIKNESSKRRKIFWYTKSIPFCSKTGYGSKVDYNLGWLLGFRNIDYEIEPNQTIIAESILDLIDLIDLIKSIFISLINNSILEIVLFNSSNFIIVFLSIFLFFVCLILFNIL